MPSEKTNTIKIEMSKEKDNEFEISQTSDDTSSEILHDVLEKNITSISHYNIRNREIDQSNPFFIIKGKNFWLGALTVNILEKNKKEQILFLFNTFKLPKNNNLIQFEFWQGNSWITVGFDFEEDSVKINST